MSRIALRSIRATRLVDRAGLMDVPQARVAVLDGSAHVPGQPWKRGKQTIKTLWGELAWQLGGAEAFALVSEADATGTSPGKNALRDLLELHAPWVVLIDEVVEISAEFPDGAMDNLKRAISENARALGLKSADWE